MDPCGLITPCLVSSQAPEPVNSHTSLVKVKAVGAKLWWHKVDKSLVAGFSMGN